MNLLLLSISPQKSKMGLVLKYQTQMLSVVCEFQARWPKKII